MPLLWPSEMIEPGPTAADRDGKRLSMSEMVASIKDIPVYTGRLGVRRGRTTDQAPSAPTTRS